MKGLSRESRALIDAARDGDNPSADDRKRVRAALARKIAVGAAAGAAAVTATHVAQAGMGSVAAGTGAAAGGVAGAAGVAGTATAGAGTSMAAGVLATGFGAKLLVSVAIVGAVGAGTVSYARHESAKHAAAPAQATVAAADQARRAGPVLGSGASGAPGRTNAAATPTPRADEMVASPPAAPAPAPSPVVASPTLAPVPQANVVAPSPAPSSTTPDLDAELALLQEAHAALRGNEGARALRLLQEHARRFPNGQLGEESEAARVFALCELGRVDEARDVAGRFLREHPRSPLAPRVSRACDAEPSTF